MATIKLNIINSSVTKTPREAVAAAIDVACRSVDAQERNNAFTDADHVNRVNAVKDIASKFFTVRENIFTNHRTNNTQGRPFTAVKVYRTQWPRVSPRVANTRFYKPLEALGNLELLRDREGTSHIIRVYI